MDERHILSDPNVGHIDRYRVAVFVNDSAARSSPDSCAFAYSSKIRDEIIIPTLKAHGQKLYWLFKLDNPAAIVKGREVTLILDQNTGAIDSYAFVIVLNTCTLNVVKAYETPPTYVFAPEGD
jgi:hypothetical protein